MALSTRGAERVPLNAEREGSAGDVGAGAVIKVNGAAVAATSCNDEDVVASAAAAAVVLLKTSVVHGTSYVQEKVRSHREALLLKSKFRTHM